MLILSCHAAEPNVAVAAEPIGWVAWFWKPYEEVKNWARGELASVSTEATDEAITKLNTKTIPEVKKAAEELMEKGKIKVAQGIEYTSTKLRESLNASSTHNAKELAVAGFCLLTSYFGLKLIYDGFNKCDETCDKKARLKIRYGSLMTAASIVTAWLYFRQA